MKRRCDKAMRKEQRRLKREERQRMREEQEEMKGIDELIEVLNVVFCMSLLHLLLVRTSGVQMIF